jgi:hypothetical protein
MMWAATKRMMKIVLIGAEFQPVTHSDYKAHPDDDTLEQYALGRLRAPKLRPVEEHLLVCHSCQDRLMEVDDFVQSLATAANELPAEEPRRRWWQSLWPVPRVAWVPAMACLAVALVVVQWPQHTAQPQVLALRAVRGQEQPVQASPGSPLELRLGQRGLASGQPYRIEIADARGTNVWFGSVTWSEGEAMVSVPRPLTPGTYWVRVFEVQPDGELLREYGLRVGD